ncbi:hypothetical protein NPX13_g6848 [Xylaria arbuscula]|uniref:Uncharacterized protein n=1 Tax=Xylaria arbuscula TaxID=114810 RepID=A0A9W8NBF6_9PEZI|nr:hypothetical protein NPX13_g6848 [Xylaria arbuscula]
MAVLEIAQRKLKGDPALVKEVDEKLAPGLIAALQNGGVTNALRGFLVSEDGKDVSGEYRELFLMGS